ncbi:hypothetical protein LS74_007320 [Helicobacter magdeburgensis]|uniref:Uncharacterized protein n=1 Tax=Helicobacter magdeburgensis TaxID=471858 RepID=A0A4V6I1D8_9HELI|nr:hypothetical protein LS74_007320 [Helicobacter magdeburgensis]
MSLVRFCGSLQCRLGHFASMDLLLRNCMRLSHSLRLHFDNPQNHRKILPQSALWNFSRI